MGKRFQMSLSLLLVIAAIVGVWLAQCKLHLAFPGDPAILKGLGAANFLVVVLAASCFRKWGYTSIGVATLVAGIATVVAAIALSALH